MKRLRPWARTAGGAAATLFLALLSSPALPQTQTLTTTIENTAYVSYKGSAGGTGEKVTVDVTSNTVTFTITPVPTPAIIDFFAYTDASDPGAVDFPVDGGQCRDSSGEFGPLPNLDDSAGAGSSLPGTAASAARTSQYVAGDTIVVRVQDLNRNEDPTAREYIEITITTSAGDEEVLLLQETGIDTGVFAAAIESVAIPPPATPYDCLLSVGPDEELTAAYIDPGFPSDTVTTTAVITDIPEERVMVLQKQASVPVAAAGDFVQYRLELVNTADVALSGVRITDLLPPGFRYQAGSLRVDGVKVEPNVSAGGRLLEIPVGSIAAGANVQATYVLRVGPAASVGDAINRAVAGGARGVVSNPVEAVVRIREPLMTSHFTIIGQVLAGACHAEPSDLVPVPGVRIVMDDGTYVGTDENGMYHVEGLRPGTHVVQIDKATVPADLEAVQCRQNTRFAGRGYSQFVEADGGALMRADFRLQPRAPEQGEVGMRLQLSELAGKLRHQVSMDVGAVGVSNFRAMLMLPDGARYVPGSATMDGKGLDDPVVAGNLLTFAVGDAGPGWRGSLVFDADAGACPAAGHASKAVALFNTSTGAERTPPADALLPCNASAGPGDSGRQAREFVHTATADKAVSPFLELANKRAEMAANAKIATGDRDWLTGQTAGNDWILPAGASASPTESVVVKHLAGHVVKLRLNGAPVDGRYADGRRTSRDKTFGAVLWRGIPMVDGDNVFEADIVDPGGAVVATLSKTLRYSNDIARAVLVPEESVLIADGIHNPVIAVRMLDNLGKPVRPGMHGEFSVLPPYEAAHAAEAQQQRQLAGLEAFKPTWQVEGNDGIAYIELQPTSLSGEATLGFEFRIGDRRRSQEMKAWLKSTPRDWIVVGFAKGTVGYDTLSGNMEALDEAGHEEGTSTDGQLSFYAKGRVKGEWMLTLAYDSDKPTDRLRREGLLSTIDPQQFYTLYGDGTAQAYDAASQEKLYLKLERDTFYALFGDFSTGLSDGQLTNYHRTLNGLKVEYQGPILEVNAFAAETEQSFARDEIQGDGTSGLYRLAHRNVAINGERVTIETRDRFRSEIIIETRTLSRHIDYDIDYDAGTLFFRQPVPSRDFDFNPVFIVVEYETIGSGTEYLSAGGRVGVKLLDGKLETGLTYIHDEGLNGQTQLGGIDARYRVSDTTEVRAELASSKSEVLGTESSGTAYLVEVDHHGENYDLRGHVQRLGNGFGMGQQNASERGMFKAGIDGQWRISDTFALQGQVVHQEDLASGVERDAMALKGEYRADNWSMEAGLQWVRDTAPDGMVRESRQVTVGGNRKFGRLELRARADIGIDGANDSVDYPNRYEVGAAYALTETFRVLVAHEITDGEERDTSTTRVGFEAQPWAGATLKSTLNQSAISEYGPRTFGVLGLQQRFTVGERWSFDLSADTSRAFNESGNGDLVVNDEHPIASGGIRNGGALTEDFIALSGGATYRAELWSWTGRLEGRDGANADRRGFDTSFLRQAQAGVAFAASAQAFTNSNADGSRGLLASANLAWAWRPLGSRWSILDRLEFRVDEIRRGNGEAVIGNDTLAVSGDARSRRLVNNFVMNYHGDAWTQDDRRGNLFDVSQRSQLSLYYGSKYVFDTYDGEDYSGYTDILGVEWRHDLTSKIDIGLRASVRHSWDEHEYSYAFGPSVGFSPFTNTWFSLGYNVVGFSDRDFESMHYTAQGAYLMLRFKFDQDTLGLAKKH